MDSNHYHIISQSLMGDRSADEETFASLEILSERLERVKKLDKSFGKIEFSPAVKKLKRQKNTVAVC